MESYIRDVKYSLRSLLRDKAFAATVLLTLAVCIAANTATFAIVNSVILRPLPVPDAADIVLMANHYPKAGAANLEFSSAADYYDRLHALTALREQAMFRFEQEPLEINGMPEQVRGMSATPSLFPLLRIAPAHGRTFTEPEGEIGNEQKVVLSDALWRTLYGGDLSVIGRDLRIGGRPYTIVGVMPPGFNFVDPAVRFWVPLAFTPHQKTAYHNNNWYDIGRLKPAATVAQVQAQLNALNAANLDRFPQFKTILLNAGFYSSVEPLQHMIIKGVEGTLYLLWGGAVFVLLIGALNLANVSFARLTIRRKEMATKLALGGARIQLLRQMVIENVLIATAGGIAGLALGMALLRTLAAVGFDRFPRAAEVHIGPVVVLAALGMSIAVGVLIGLLPLLDGFNIDVNSVLRADSRGGTSGVRTRRLRQVLVGAEIGFAFVLLAGAGLLFASFRNLLDVDPGFTRERVLTASTNAPRSRYPNDEALAALMRRSLGAIRALPGVVSAGATTTIPFGGDHSDSVIFAEGYVTKPGESLISPNQVSVTPGYFEAMQTRLLRGRAFGEQDTSSSQPVIIVDEKLARHFWPDRDPLGQRMFQPQDPSNLTHTDKNTRWLKVVGVVASVRLEDLAGTGSPVGAYYFPYAQSVSREFTLAIKTAGQSSSVNQSVRAAIAKIDPELALFDVQTMTERAELSVYSRKTSMLLSLGFGVLALFLSAIGIYGVLTYLVTQRRREIGIRIALGSTPAGVVRLVAREGLLLVAIGLGLGFAGTVAVQKVIATQIYGIHPLDPAVLGTVILLLALIAFAACSIPALRAVRVDPVQVLTEQ